MRYSIEVWLLPPMLNVVVHRGVLEEYFRLSSKFQIYQPQIEHGLAFDTIIAPDVREIDIKQNH